MHLASEGMTKDRDPALNQTVKSLSPLFRRPVGRQQQSDARGNGDTAINRPPNLSCHETTRKHVDPLQKPGGAAKTKRIATIFRVILIILPRADMLKWGLPPEGQVTHDRKVVITSPFPIVFCGFPLPCWAMNRPYCKTVMIDRISWSIVLKLPSLLRGVRGGCVMISGRFDFRLSCTQENDLT